MANNKNTSLAYSKATIKKEEWGKCSENYVIDTNKRGNYVTDVGKNSKPFKLANPKFTK